MDNSVIKDERWAIKTFRPLLRLLNVEQIPAPPAMTLVVMADDRNWIVKGMGKCVVVIEQYDLPENIGGMLITSHDPELGCFKLHILISAGLCGKTNFDERVKQKIAAIHEFTHTVAALSAIARVKSEELVKRLKRLLNEKTHSLKLQDLAKLAAEISETPYKQNEADDERHFPDEHYRLGFEDFPVSYPVILEEFLFSKEMFEEYCPPDVFGKLCKSLDGGRDEDFISIAASIIVKICEENILSKDFLRKRFIRIFTSYYTDYLYSPKNNYATFSHSAL